MAAAEGGEDGAGDEFGLGHASGANHAAGEIAGAGLDDADAALAQGFEIGLGGGVLPHVDVHGGGDEHGRGGGEVHGGEEVVGHAVRKFGQGVGGGGGDDEGVGPLGFGDVLDGGSRHSGRAESAVAHRLVMTLCPVRAAKVSG